MSVAGGRHDEAVPTLRNWAMCGPEKEGRPMFCPKCKAEYREGFYTCSDCNVKLVRELPPEPKPEAAGNADYEELMGTNNRGDIAFIKSVLDGEGIIYFFKGEHLLNMGTDFYLERAKLMVKRAHAKKARAILKDLKLL
jgi:hypothetical protein